MKFLLIATIFMVGVSLLFLGLIFFCTRTIRPKKWWEVEPTRPIDDTPEPESKPESNRIKL